MTRLNKKLLPCPSSLYQLWFHPRNDDLLYLQVVDIKSPLRIGSLLGPSEPILIRGQWHVASSY